MSLWQSACVTAPAWYKGVVYWPCFGLFAFDAATGSSVFKVSVGGNDVVSMAIGDGGVVVIVVMVNAYGVAVRSAVPCAVGWRLPDYSPVYSRNCHPRTKVAIAE